MTDYSTVSAPVSAEITKRQRALKVKIYDWKKKGYNVARFTKPIQNDISVIEEEFQEFLKTVKQLENIEERLYRLETNGFVEHIKRIEDMIKDPEKIEELEKEMILLEESIAKKKIESSGLTEKEEMEAALKNELDKIREEELHRIREQEGERIREQERKRILKDELKRIREEERERLKISELGRIRKEEKERLVWEDRVVRQLRQTKEQQNERSGKKKMTCPQCKGTIPISSANRPLKVRCPQCGKDYTLRSKGEERSKDGNTSKINYKKCPKCSSPIPIVSNKRPLKVICQMCNSEYLLKSKTDDPQSSAPGGTSKALANKSLPMGQSRSQGLETKDYGSQEFSGSDTFITCPTCNQKIPGEAKVCGYCGSPIDHTEIERKQVVSCPNCGKEIPGDAKICGYCGNAVHSQQPSGTMNDFELPLSPNEKILDDLGEKKVFKPLNNYSLPTVSELSGPGPAPAGSMEQLGGPTDGITCSKCGNLVPRGSKFCGVCGNTM